MDLIEMVCGQRMTFNYIRVGGVSRDLTPEFVPKAKEFTRYFEPKVDEYEDILTNNPIFLARTKGIGVLPQKLAIDYSITGPNLRATGLRWDLRKNEPYSVYDKFDFEIPAGKNSDTWDRYMVRIREMREANHNQLTTRGSLPLLAWESGPLGSIISSILHQQQWQAGHVTDYDRQRGSGGEV